MIYLENDEVYHEAARKVFERTRGIKADVSKDLDKSPQIISSLEEEDDDSVYDSDAYETRESQLEIESKISTWLDSLASDPNSGFNKVKPDEWVLKIKEKFPECTWVELYVDDNKAFFGQLRRKNSAVRMALSNNEG